MSGNTFTGSADEDVDTFGGPSSAYHSYLVRLSGWAACDTELVVCSGILLFMGSVVPKKGPSPLQIDHLEIRRD